MGIYIGTKPLESCYIGTKKVIAIYKGTDLQWRKSSAVYTPILTTDTDTYPLYLKGWSKYTFTSVTAAASGSVYVRTSINGKTPSTCFCSDYVGESSTTNSADRPNKRAQYRYKTEATADWAYLKDTDIGTTTGAWNTYLASHPIDILFELEESDNSLWFAVTDETNFGYYCPATQTFMKVYGMTGTKIERVEYIEFDGEDNYVNTGVNLIGSDTVTIDFSYQKSGSNVFGSWRSSNADVYTLYASTSKSYVRYASSLYRNTSIPTDTRVTFQMTPTGASVNDVQTDSWTETSFDSATPCLVGWLNGSGSPHLSGNVYDFSINNKSHLIPVKIGTDYYLFDCLKWSLPNHNGTFVGGSTIDSQIQFPSSIPEEPTLLMMGGNPFYPIEPEIEEPEESGEFEE